ncbi:S41 family peptidase [Aquiflexum sp.]|uniref:S41 family peptidase n=1 Tax=Aquiflexum sp. TaxID=1872584 RepID=UPI003593D2C4
MNLRAVFLSLFSFLLIACGEDEPPVPNEADNFLNQVLTIMEKNSIYKNEIDWKDFRNQVTKRAEAAKNIDETYPAIQLALTLLGDNHSVFMKPDGSTIRGTSSLTCGGEAFSRPILPENIGYIAVKISSGSDNEKMIAYAEEIQKAIKTVDNENVLGWIVDLRGSGGGNMWPALAGIGPILGEGIAGYFIDPNDKQTSWGYSNGASVVNQTRVVQLLNPYELINPNPKVAVLYDKGIASSGEAIAIFFIGRDNTKSFGTPTCGLSTSNSGFNLSNNATLYLTVSYMADRKKQIYGLPVAPDMESFNQTIIQQAIEYIEN